MILLLDNYDSFVHNLARYFQRLGHSTKVIRSDAIAASEVRRMAPAAVVISPGPCTPSEAGCSLEVVRELTGTLPILGVCLGHQSIAAALGATIGRAPEPLHGRASLIQHSGRGLFADLPDPLRVGRYHSLIVERDSLPAELEVAAQTQDGIVMAIAHRHLPVAGVQFHPESILTEHGYEILANFLRLAGIEPQENLDRPYVSLQESEQSSALLPAFAPPTQPVTF